MATAPTPNDLTRQQLDELDALLQRMLNLPLTAVDPPPPAPTGGPPTAANWRADPPAPGPVPHQGADAPRSPASVELPRPPARAPKVTVTVQPAAEVALAAPPRPPTPALAAPPPEPAVPVLPARPVAELARHPGAYAPGSAEPEPTPAPAVGYPEPAPADDGPPIITPPARAAHRGAYAPRPKANASRVPVTRPGADAPHVTAAAPSSTPHSALRTPHSPLLWPLVAFDRAACAVLGLLGPPGWLLRSGFGKNLLGLAGLGLLAYTAAHVAADRGWVTLPAPLPWPR
jgi:hypothetical protein